MVSPSSGLVLHLRKLSVLEWMLSSEMTVRVTIEILQLLNTYISIRADTHKQHIEGRIC